MIIGATIGGLFGDKLPKRMNKQALRAIVIIIGTVLTVSYFVKA
jgi:uncharacterized membrane protein YfcA